MLVYDIVINQRADPKEIKFDLLTNREFSKFGNHPGIYMFYNSANEVEYIGGLLDLRKKLPYIRYFNNIERLKSISKIRCFAFEDDEVASKQVIRDMLGMIVVKLQPKYNFFNTKRKYNLWRYVEGASDIIIRLSRKSLLDVTETYDCKSIKRLERDYMKHIRRELLTGDDKEVTWKDYGAPDKDTIVQLTQCHFLDSKTIADIYNLPKRLIDEIIDNQELNEEEHKEEGIELNKTDPTVKEEQIVQLSSLFDNEHS